MDRIVIEGIILRVTPYGDSDQIASLFTLQEGKIQAITRARSKKSGQETLSPLLRVEGSLIATRTSLYRAEAFSICDSYPPLRTTYRLLQHGCLLLQAIDTSQQGQKTAPKLYQLLSYYLKRLHELEQSENGVSSFYLKILRHEGLFTLDAFTAQTEEEKTIITFLAHVLEWDALIPLVLPAELHATIADVFKTQFR